MYQDITLLGLVTGVNSAVIPRVDLQVADDSFAAQYRVFLQGEERVKKDIALGDYLVVNRGRFHTDKAGNPNDKKMFILSAYTGFSRLIKSDRPMDNYAQAMIIGNAGETFLTDKGAIVQVFTHHKRQGKSKRVIFYVEIDRDTLRHTYIKNGMRIMATGIIVNAGDTGGPARRDLNGGPKEIFLIRAIEFEVIR